MDIRTRSHAFSYRKFTATFALLISILNSAFAIKDPQNQGNWTKPCKEGPDTVVPGFLINLGPTGARAILKQNTFVVKYIFKSSPARDRLEINDVIYGANKKQFADHTFGGTPGIEGPIQDLGLAIEDSEGSDGILHLMVKRGEKKIDVKIQLEKLGRFADSFPMNCKKTNLLKERAYKYLVKNQDGLQSQGRCVATLALLGSDEKKFLREGKKMAKAWNKPYGNETWSWHLGFQGIALSEYHLLTGDRKVLKTLKSTMYLLNQAQWKGEITHWKAEKGGPSQATINKHQALYAGGFGHEPYSVVFSRGGGGYGPMQLPTKLALLTWQLSKRCGIEVDQEAIDRSFTFLDHGTTAAGKIAYGGEFTMNNGPIDWKNWKKDKSNGASYKSGLAYLLYSLSSDRKDAHKMQKLHLSNMDAAYKDMPDGHACALMGFTWGLAGTFASDKTKLKKKVAKYYKAWLNMARCHGSDSYITLPSRDYSDFSYYRGNIRNHTTASVAFIYSFSNPVLQITGLNIPKNIASKKTKQPKARKLSKNNQRRLNQGLIKALSALDQRNELKKEPIQLSRARTKVWLAAVDSSKSLTFQSMVNEKQASFGFKELKTNDYANLATLLAELQPENQESLASAGVYHELLGDTKTAHTYYDKVNPKVLEKIDQFFEQ